MLNTILSLILLSCDFENGYVPQWSTMSYQSKSVYSYGAHCPTFFTSIKPRIEFKGFYIISDNTFYWTYKEGRTGTPFRSVFDFETGYTINRFTLKYAHNCGHTITTVPDDLHTCGNLYDICHDKFSFTIHIGK
jgi:hypothetical protein